LIEDPNKLSFFTLEAECAIYKKKYSNLVAKALVIIQSETKMENKKISIKVCGSMESTKLNKKFRQKNQPTNVLAFPSNGDEFSFPDHLGDILICDEVVLDEANSLGIDFDERFTHMVIHGILHLLGYLHNNESTTCVMEMLESKIMSKLGYSDPYLKY